MTSLNRKKQRFRLSFCQNRGVGQFHRKIHILGTPNTYFPPFLTISGILETEIGAGDMAIARIAELRLVGEVGGNRATVEMG